MNTDDVVWEWFNGLVRRTTFGVLVFVACCLVTSLLVSARWTRDQELSDLGAYTSLHRKYVRALRHTAELADRLDRDVRVREAVEPVRRQLAVAVESSPRPLPCAETCLRDLEGLQVRWRPLTAGAWTPAVGREVDLRTLGAFERGLVALQQVQASFEQFCERPSRRANVCDYYRDFGERHVGALAQFRGNHFQQTLTEAETRMLGLPPGAAAAPLLTHHRRVAFLIDPSARPTTLAEFEALEAAISARRVSVQTQDTRLTSAPAGGLFTMALPQEASYVALNAIGFLAILFAFLNIHKLNGLLAAHPANANAPIYALAPVASSAFSAPVFGRPRIAALNPGWARRISRFLLSIFSQAPLIALGCAITGYFLLLPDTFGARVSPASLVASAALLGLQAIVLVAFVRERHALVAQFFSWAAAGSPTAPTAPSPVSGPASSDGASLPQSPAASLTPGAPP